MKNILMILAAVLVLGGCAAAQTVKSDYETGKTTPLAHGEQSPQDQAKIVESAVAVIPGVGGFAPAVGFIVGIFLTYVRGRKIRLAQATSTVPATGFIGNAAGIEQIVQKLSSVVAGLFEVGPDGSPIKRGWKSALTTAVGLVGVALMFPSVQSYLIQNPQVPAVITAISGVFGAVEKQLSVIKPVVSESSSGADGAKVKTLTV